MTIRTITTKLNNLIHNYTFQAIVLSLLAAALIVTSVMSYLGLTGPI